MAKIIRSMKESSDYTVYAVFPTKNGYIVNTDIKGYQYIQIVDDKITKRSAWREDWFANAKKRAGFKDFDEDDMEERLLRRYEKDVRYIIDHSDLGLNESKKFVRKLLKESKSDFNLHELQRYYSFRKEWDNELKPYGIDIREIIGDKITFSINSEKYKFYNKLIEVEEIIEDNMPIFLAKLLSWTDKEFGCSWTYGDEEEIDGFQYVDFIIW